MPDVCDHRNNPLILDFIDDPAIAVRTRYLSSPERFSTLAGRGYSDNDSITSKTHRTSRLEISLKLLAIDLQKTILYFPMLPEILQEILMANKWNPLCFDAISLLYFRNKVKNALI